MAYERREADQRVDSREEAQFVEEKKFAYSVVKKNNEIDYKDVATS